MKTLILRGTNVLLAITIGSMVILFGISEVFSQEAAIG